MKSDKEYLGDGVYVRYDGYHLILTTERLNDKGQVKHHDIFLEPNVLENLNLYHEKVRKKNEIID